MCLQPRRALLQKTQRNRQRLVRSCESHFELQKPKKVILETDFISEKVYAALNTRKDVIAVKTKKPIKNKKFTDIANTLFRSEIEVLYQLKHPNIVKFMGAEFNGANEPKSVVMEYIQGDCLDLILKDTDGINESLIKVYTYQILNAIVFMHSKNIMHRFFNYISCINYLFV
jgi:serine/threonine protein kinase